ncbi:phage holin family protein [Streptococcus uberis]|uniref:phage holin family protein n=1 Tax=Streptococcus uberis TaxID=1349 RepID=UPI00193A9676|nr:phage holin family protein [Streptococcus uberis]
MTNDITPNVALTDLFHNMKDVFQSPVFQFFIFLLVVDILTGYSKAFKTKKFDSKIGTNGMLRHLMVTITIIAVGVFARVLNYQLVSVSYCMFYIWTYAYSILENWEVLGWGFPPQLKPFVNQMKKQSEQKVVDVLEVKTAKIHKTESHGPDLKE